MCARRNLQVQELKGFLGGLDVDSNPFDVPEDCVISCSNVLPSLSVGGLQVINGYTLQNPNSPLSSRYLKDDSGNQIKDDSGTFVKGN